MEPAAPQEAVLSNVLRASENRCNSSLDKDMGELVVGFSQMESEGAWRIAETQSMEDQEGRVANVIITDAQGDLAKHITDVPRFDLTAIPYYHMLIEFPS